MRRTGRIAATILATLTTASQAATIADPAGDFLSTYTGPQNGDLDILSATATFDGTNFRVASVQDGAVGSTANSLFVFGINRGAGTARFQTMGAPPPVGAGILFDSAFVLFPNGNASVVNFQPMGPPAITLLPGVVTVSGNSIAGVVPLSLLPTTGFAAADYTFAMWTRRRLVAAMDSGNFEIPDFAPDAAGFRASAVPEPAAWATMILGFGLTGAALRRRRLRNVTWGARA